MATEMTTHHLDGSGCTTRAVGCPRTCAHIEMRQRHRGAGRHRQGVVSPAASTLCDEMAVSGQRLLAASGQIPMAAHRLPACQLSKGSPKVEPPMARTSASVSRTNTSGDHVFSISS
jgi:hypothetical protein